MRTLAERFWSKVPTRPTNDDACWEWQGARTSKGYGKIQAFSNLEGAHRVSLVLSGITIPPGKIVRHRCDNPPCIRPTHLLVGTYGDNHRDSVFRGRWNSQSRARRGTQHQNAKLTDEKVREIRRRAKTQSLLSLAHEYGVSWPVIDGVVKRRLWRHVTDLERAVLEMRPPQ